MGKSLKNAIFDIWFPEPSRTLRLTNENILISVVLSKKHLNLGVDFS